MKILTILEATTYMRDIASKDFLQIKTFFNYIEENHADYNLSLDEVMRFVLTLKSKKGALRNVAGSGENVSRSFVQRGASRETNQARAFGDKNDVNLGDKSKDIMFVVGMALDAAGYAEIQNINPKDVTITKDPTSRLLKFINVLKSQNFKTVEQVVSNFDEAVSIYQNSVKDFVSDISPSKTRVDQSENKIQNITPNVLIFLASVSKRMKRGKSWSQYIDPKDYYDNPPLHEYVPDSYNPEQAANDLIGMGFGKKMKDGRIGLNKGAIQTAVKNFRSQFEDLKKSTIEHPSNVSTRTLKPTEKNAQALVNKISSLVSNDIKKMGEMKLASALRKATESTGDESYINAYKFYVNKLDQSLDSEGVGDASRRAKSTHLGSVINFLKAKIIARMLYYYASLVVDDGKKWKTHNKDWGFTGPKELSMVKNAFLKGPMKPSRI